MTDLYRKAFEIKKSGLWDIFLEEQIFALKDKDGDTVFIQIRKNDEEEKTVSVYYGEDTLEMVRRIMDVDPETMADDEEVLHLEAMIEGVELTYTNKAGLSEEEQKEAVAAAAAYGIKPRGSGAYPRFSRLRKGQPQAELKETSDIQIMNRALDAAMWFIEGKEGKVRLFIPTEDKAGYEMAAVEEYRGKYRQSFIKIPELGKMKYPAGVNSNEILQKRIKNMKKRGSWACRLVRLDTPSGWGGGSEKVLPSVIKTICLDKSEIVDMIPVAYYEIRTEVVLDKFMEAICRYGSCPVQILVMDDRTYSILRQWCKNCAIKLERVEYIPELDMPEGIYESGMNADEFMESGFEYIETAIDFLLSLPDEALSAMPDELKSVREIKESGADALFSQEFRRKLNRLIKKMDKLDL
ncbi:MAG: hypothetical protein J6X66_11910 [Lachnospiraceae bacterium]|nr:hypothetical protein [Lachnospiraceae bacterium]